MKKIKKEYIETYETISFVEKLADNKYLKENYIKNGSKWIINYESNSAFHLCPFRPSFIDCIECEYFKLKEDKHECSFPTSSVTTEELIKRINRYVDCGGVVQYNGAL